MAWEQPGMTLAGQTAAGDLSTKQYRFMKVSAAGVVTTCSAATDYPIGVLQNAPGAAGRDATVMISGVSKVVAGGNLAAGDLVGTDANGAAVKLTIGTDTTKYVRGQALAAAASGDLVAVRLVDHGRAA